MEFLNLVQSCSTLCCPVGACVLALVIIVLLSLLFRLKLSFCLIKYVSKGVVLKKD